MTLVYTVAAIFILVQLAYPAVSVSIAAFFRRQQPKANGKSTVFDYACIITAYKNAEIARPLIASLLHQTYHQFQVYLVADECPETDFSEFSTDPRFTVVRPQSPLRLKIKSIRAAVSQFVRPHDYIVVFDADNLAHPDFLKVTNRFANAGYSCIQGQRTAKNLDTVYAALDSLGEFYKNYIERYVPFRLGGSAVISGSGMATAEKIYREYLESSEIQAGQHQGKRMLQEDKILQNFLLRRNIRIAYAWDAVVYDEKVTSAHAVTTQRSRWLFSYFQNIPNAAGILFRGLVRLRWNQIYFGFVTLVLPMFIQIAAAGLLILIGLFITPALSAALVGGIMIFSLTVIATLYLSEAPPTVTQAVWQAPKFVFRQVLALVKMGDPQRNFNHTEHSKYVKVEDLLK